MSGFEKKRTQNSGPTRSTFHRQRVDGRGDVQGVEQYVSRATPQVMIRDDGELTEIRSLLVAGDSNLDAVRYCDLDNGETSSLEVRNGDCETWI